MSDCKSKCKICDWTADGWRKHDGDAQSHAHGGVLAHAVAAAGRPPPPQRAVLLTPHPALTEWMWWMECAATHASRYQSSCSCDKIWYPDFDRIITFDIRIWEKFDINIPNAHIWYIVLLSCSLLLDSLFACFWSTSILNTVGYRDFGECCASLFKIKMYDSFWQCLFWHCWLGGRKGIRPVKTGDGGSGHWLV